LNHEKAQAADNAAHGSLQCRQPCLALYVDVSEVLLFSAAQALAHR
jgi:hypothetical protein